LTEPTDPPSGEDTPATDGDESQPAEPSESRTRIIRRAPTGPLPTITPSEATQLSPATPPPAPTGTGRRAAPAGISATSPGADARTAIAACAVSIVSGWTTSVVATDLIAGWWHTDRLFCVAVGFLALVFAASTIAGVIMLLLHRPLGRYLIAGGAVVALLTYGGVFIAGARVGWIVYTLWLLPLASIVLSLHGQTKRWLDG
jgi:hypothetical protein